MKSYEFDNSDRHVLMGAIELWGEDAQRNQAIEEMAELVVELARIPRGRTDDFDMVNEIADVRIVLRQLEMMWGEEEVAERVEKKMERFERLILECGGAPHG